MGQEAHSTSAGASHLVSAMGTVLAWGVLGLLELEWHRQGGVMVGNGVKAASEDLSHCHFIPKLRTHKCKQKLGTCHLALFLPTYGQLCLASSNHAPSQG